MSKVLAFDFGASSGRAILANYENGKLFYEEVHRFENNPVEENGTLYWDFNALFNEVQIGISKVSDFDSIGFDTWGVDFGLIDKDGKLIGKPVHYRDTRTDEAIKKAFLKISKKELYSKTGVQIMSINTLYQMMATDFTGVHKILFMPDLFAYMLTGNICHELTISSTSQILNPVTKDFDKDILSTFEIDENLLSKPVLSGTITGEYKGAKVIAVAGHDTQCASAAIPTDKTDVAFLSCGTWSLLGTELDDPVLTEESLKLNLSNEIGANGKVNYLKNIIGLWLIQESRRAYRRNGEEYSYADLEELALAEKPLKYFIDPDASEFAVPGDVPTLVKEFCERTGQGRPETVGEVMRCIYESLALKYRYAVNQLEQIVGYKFSKLHILGGGTKDKLLCQLTSNSIARTVIAGPIEATALGNIIIQLVALGDIKDINEGRKIIAQTEKLYTYEPTDKTAWDEAYEKYTNYIMEEN